MPCFISTFNDRPEIRALYAGFDVEPVELTHRRAGASTVGRELIVGRGS